MEHSSSEEWASRASTPKLIYISLSSQRLLAHAGIVRCFVKMKASLFTEILPLPAWILRYCNASICMYKKKKMLQWPALAKPLCVTMTQSQLLRRHTYSEHQARSNATKGTLKCQFYIPIPSPMRCCLRSRLNEQGHQNGC